MNDPYKDIHSFIETQENAYKSSIQLPGGWQWGMQEHVETSYLYAHSQLKTGKNDYKPVKNITRPILNLQHRVEDIEVKDVQLYVDDPSKYHLSFLVKKYHDDVFTRENDIDTFLDELNISRIDYGGGLSKKTSKGAEVVPLQSIVFCDQTDILSGPIGIKHFYAPDQLMDMESKGWGNPANGATGSLQDVIQLARDSKREDQNRTDVKTPGKYIEVYEVHGNFPKRFLNENDDSGLFTRQLHIVTTYQKKDSTDRGFIILFAGEEAKNPFKLIKRDPVYGRALGFGGAEELFEPQVWVNYDMIRKQDMLDAAAKTIMVTSDPDLAAKHPNGLKDMDNMEFIEEMQGGNTHQLDTFPRNMQLFDKSISDWEIHAQQMGAANDAIMGEQPTAGTPFKLQELVTQESHGLHEYRRGQYAKHIEELYTDWFIPQMQKAICQGATFLSELSLEDLQYVTDSIITNMANRRVIDMVLAGETPTQDEIDVFKELQRDELKKKGNKYFIEILKGEFKSVPLAVKVDVLGKSKNLSQHVDKLVNIFRTALANPLGFAQIMQIPGMAKSYNDILEGSGLSPADFTGIDKVAEKIQASQAPQPAPGAPQAPQMAPTPA